MAKNCQIIVITFYRNIECQNCKEVARALICSSSKVALGIYWSISAYTDWQGSPVLTTVATTAFAIKNVEFPAITICAPGTVKAA